MQASGHFGSRNTVNPLCMKAATKCIIFPAA